MLLAIASCSQETDNGNVLWLTAGEPEVDAEVMIDTTIDLKNDGFIIRDTPEGRKIMAKTQIGAMTFLLKGRCHGGTDTIFP